MVSRSRRGTGIGGLCAWMAVVRRVGNGTRSERGRSVCAVSSPAPGSCRSMGCRRMRCATSWRVTDATWINSPRGTRRHVVRCVSGSEQQTGTGTSRWREPTATLRTTNTAVSGVGTRGMPRCGRIALRRDGPAMAKKASRHQYNRSRCQSCGKMVHGSRKAAAHAAARARRENGVIVAAYRCPDTGDWHIGHPIDHRTWRETQEREERQGRGDRAERADR